MTKCELETVEAAKRLQKVSKAIAECDASESFDCRPQFRSIYGFDPKSDAMDWKIQRLMARDQGTVATAFLTLQDLTDGLHQRPSAIAHKQLQADFETVAAERDQLKWKLADETNRANFHAEANRAIGQRLGCATEDVVGAVDLLRAEVNRLNGMEWVTALKSAIDMRAKAEKERDEWHRQAVDNLAAAHNDSLVAREERDRLTQQLAKVTRERDHSIELHVALSNDHQELLGREESLTDERDGLRKECERMRGERDRLKFALDDTTSNTAEKIRVLEGQLEIAGAECKRLKRANEAWQDVKSASAEFRRRADEATQSEVALPKSDLENRIEQRAIAATWLAAAEYLDGTPEDVLAELLALIRGEGRWSFLGGGIWTWPGSDDRNDKLHHACEQLERRGQVIRALSEHGGILWRPASS